MINTVLFDMGGTLEDIYSNAESKMAAAQGVLRILRDHGVDVQVDEDAALRMLSDGWDRYAAYRNPSQRELKPEEIWGNYVLTDFGLDFETVRPFAEELAHMWEVTHYHRSLRPRVKEMLEGLKGLGMKLGVISNTASLFQVYEILKEGVWHPGLLPGCNAVFGDRLSKAGSQYFQSFPVPGPVGSCGVRLRGRHLLTGCDWPPEYGLWNDFPHSLLPDCFP